MRTLDNRKLNSWLSRLSSKRRMLLLLLTGLLILTCVDTWSNREFHREQANRQTIMAEQLHAEIQSAVDEHMTALTSLDVVYQNFVDISHYDFQQYGESITANLKGFRRLFYIDPQLIVHRIFPLSPKNMKLLGMNLSSYPKGKALLEEVRKTGKPMISPLMTFLDHPGSLLAAIPIYRNKNEFLGYAAGEISLPDIWEPLSHVDFLKRYQVQLKDSEGNLFFPDVRLKGNDRFLTRVPFQVGDKRWTLYLESLQPAYKSLLTGRIGLWSSGLLILALIMMLMTASKRHKIRSEDAQRKFETIFHASPDGILLLNEKLEIQLSNPPVRSWSGYEASDDVSAHFFDLFTCQCPHLKICRELSFLLCTSEQFNGDLPEILETQVTHRTTGVVRTLRFNASKVAGNHPQQQPDGFICILGDISTAKELERLKETYVATLTHDLKTPLLAQEMVLETILSGGAGDITHEQQRLLKAASTSIEDLLEMVNSTLLFYKLESSHLPLHKQSVGIHMLIKEVMETLRPLSENRNLTLALDSSLDLPDILADPIQLKRVFHNLISNAISYARRSSTIQVSIRKAADNHLLIGITNEGKGIPATELSRIFEKYYSLSRKFKQIGTGLGLYISRRLVELHGGKIWAESETGKETRFFISLPLPQRV